MRNLESDFDFSFFFLKVSVFFLLDLFSKEFLNIFISNILSYSRISLWLIELWEHFLSFSLSLSHTTFMMSSLPATVSAGSRLEQKTPAEYLPYSTDMLLREYDAYSEKSGLQSRNRPISEKTESEKVRALPVHHKQPLGNQSL